MNPQPATLRNKSAIVKKECFLSFAWVKIFECRATTPVRRTAVSSSSKSTGTPVVTTLRNVEDRSRCRWSARAQNIAPLSLFRFWIFPFFPYYFPFLYLYRNSHSPLFSILHFSISFSLSFSQFHLPSASRFSTIPPCHYLFPFTLSLSFSVGLLPSRSTSYQGKSTLCSPPRISPPTHLCVPSSGTRVQTCTQLRVHVENLMHEPVWLRVYAYVVRTTSQRWDQA